ncbi:MAG: ankyrin repeat domain-containing protein [Pyrinomonadaceae bacterium]
MKLSTVYLLNAVLLFACAEATTAHQANIKTYQQSRTALMRAVDRGDLRAVRRLLKKGADVNAKDSLVGQR